MADGIFNQHLRTVIPALGEEYITAGTLYKEALMPDIATIGLLRFGATFEETCSIRAEKNP